MTGAVVLLSLAVLALIVILVCDAEIHRAERRQLDDTIDALEIMRGQRDLWRRRALDAVADRAALGARR